MKITINESIADVLDRLGSLSAEDRWALLMEHLEDVATDIDIEDVLMVPKFYDEQ